MVSYGFSDALGVLTRRITYGSVDTNDFASRTYFKSHLIDAVAMEPNLRQNFTGGKYALTFNGSALDFNSISEISGAADYATQTYVTSRGYITSASLTPYLLSTTAASTYQTQSGMSSYATLASPTLTGDPKAPTPATSDNDTSIATTAFVKAQGYLTSAPVTSVAGKTGVVTLAVADVSGAAPLASPALTGTPTSTTATANTNTTQVATTAFVVGQAGSATPIVDGTAAVGTSLLYARQDHVHPTDTTRAAIAGATFTGKITTLTASTSGAGLNLGNGASPTSPAGGDVWLTANTMYFQDNGGVNRQVANTNSTNTFNSPQIIDTTSATLPALRVTQKGTAASFIVEDSTNPDTTSFVIDTSGNIGVGVAIGYTATNKLEVVGAVKATSITFDGSAQYKVNSTQTNPFGSGNISHSEYPLEMLVSYNGSTYAMPMRLVSTP
jgi:hypothetical protein